MLWCKCRAVKPTKFESYKSHWKEYTTHCVLTIGGLFSFTLKVCDNFLLVKTGFTLTLIIDPREMISLRTRSPIFET